MFDQGSLVLDRLRQLHDDMISINDRMASRANTVFGSSAGLIAFVAAGEIVAANSHVLRSAFNVASLVAGVVVCGMAFAMYRPREGWMGGSEEWDVWIEQYLDAEPNKAIDQLVSDNVVALQRRVSENGKVSKTVTNMLIAFCVQAACVGIALLFKTFLP